MEKVKMKRIEIAELFAGINNALKCGEKLPCKLSYALSRNKRLLKDTVETIGEKEKERLEKYNAEKKETIIKYADKDDKGKPIMVGQGSYSFKGRMFEVTEAIEAIDEKYKDELSEIKALVNEEEEIELMMYDSEETGEKIPDLPGDILDGIFPIIEKA